MEASIEIGDGNESKEMKFQDGEPVCKCKKCGYSWLRDSKTPIH